MIANSEAESAKRRARTPAHKCTRKQHNSHAWHTRTHTHTHTHTRTHAHTNAHTNTHTNTHTHTDKHTHIAQMDSLHEIFLCMDQHN